MDEVPAILEKPLEEVLSSQEPLIGPMPPTVRRPRIVLYSHDTCGLGHVRRNILIASALAKSPLQADILLITGVGEASAFSREPGVDILSLPALFKEGKGQYKARVFSLPLDEIIALRSRLIRTALEMFMPDIFIVDNVPLGAVKELSDSLNYLRHHASTRCVLGLRDILDDPDIVVAEWTSADNYRSVREYYDAVWVYGDPSIYELGKECRFPDDIRAKIVYTGYLNRKPPPGTFVPASHGLHEWPELDRGQLHLCVVGGGQDGTDVAENFVTAKLPSNATGVVITGPYMPEEVQERLSLLACRQERMYVIGFFAEPTVLIEEAGRVVSMGGYNSVCEIMSLKATALVVPRVIPRLEQFIRAQRLSQLGFFDVLHPDHLSSQTISDWLAQEINPEKEYPSVDLGGLTRIPELVNSLLDFKKKYRLARG